MRSRGMVGRTLSFLHILQLKHDETCAPTPTESPTLNSVTLGPTLVTLPVIL